MPFTEFYVDPAGSNLNAGSTTAAAAAHTYASGNWVQSTRVFTVASGNPLSDGVQVGDFASVYADGSTATAYIGRVSARDATTITIDNAARINAALSDGTGNRTLKIGGAWAGPSGASVFPFPTSLGSLEPLKNASGDPPRVNLKEATYSITTGIALTGTLRLTWQGFTSTPGDGGRFTIDGGTSGASYILATLGEGNVIRDAVFANNGATGSAPGLRASSSGAGKILLERVTVHSVRGKGFEDQTYSELVEVEAYNCNQNNDAVAAIEIKLGIAVRCVSRDNPGNTIGFDAFSGATFDQCIAAGNGSHGFRLRGDAGLGITFPLLLKSCDAYANGGDGVAATNPSLALVVTLENCNLIANGGYGFNGSGAGRRWGTLTHCGFGAGTMANTSGQATGVDAIEFVDNLTYANDVTPWRDPDAGDFTIVLAAARHAGRGSFGSLTNTLAWPDIGAAQHRDAGLVVIRPRRHHTAAAQPRRRRSAIVNTTVVQQINVHPVLARPRRLQHATAQPQRPRAAIINTIEQTIVRPVLARRVRLQLTRPEVRLQRRIASLTNHVHIHNHVIARTRRFV